MNIFRALILLMGLVMSAITSQTPPASVEIEAPAQVEVPTEEPTPVPVEEPEPAPAPVTTEEAAPIDTGGNWMEALLPSVDPGGLGNWIFERNGAWGASDGVNVYIDPNSPVAYHYSIMIHEYAHLLQARQYGSLSAARAVEDVESAADCYALAHGASWVNYGCSR